MLWTEIGTSGLIENWEHAQLRILERVRQWFSDHNDTFLHLVQVRKVNALSVKVDFLHNHTLFHTNQAHCIIKIDFFLSKKANFEEKFVSILRFQKQLEISDTIHSIWSVRSQKWKIAFIHERKMWRFSDLCWKMKTGQKKYIGSALHRLWI